MYPASVGTLRKNAGDINLLGLGVVDANALRLLRRYHGGQ
jgi:hypothetical protein